MDNNIVLAEDGFMDGGERYSKEELEYINSHCAMCNSEFPIKQANTCAAGYAIYNDQKICYTCCAKLDLEFMQSHGLIALYLCENSDAINATKGIYSKYKITNWPGSLVFQCLCYHKGKHNIARTRYDVWFSIPGDLYIWHGVNYGEFSQICYCKRTKTLVSEF